MTLLVVNLAIVLLIFVQAVLLKKAKHSIRSWSACFYALCFVWLMFRSVFWALTIWTTKSWDPALFYILYWMPNPIQFAAFLLLPLFFAQISHRKQWRSGWKYIRPLYIAFTVGASIFIITWSVLAAVQDRRISLLCDDGPPPSPLPRPAESYGSSADASSAALPAPPLLRGAAGGDDDVPSAAEVSSICFHAEFSSAAFRAVSAACFFVLAGVMAYFSLAMARLKNYNHGYATALRLPPRGLAITNVSLFAIFMCRGLYQAGSAMQLWHMPEVPLHGGKDIGPGLLVVFLLWDVLPTLLILMIVHTRTTYYFYAASKYARARDTLAKERTALLPDYGLFRKIKEGAGAKNRPVPLAPAPPLDYGAADEAAGLAVPSLRGPPPRSARKKRRSRRRSALLGSAAASLESSGSLREGAPLRYLDSSLSSADSSPSWALHGAWAHAETPDSDASATFLHRPTALRSYGAVDANPPSAPRPAPPRPVAIQRGHGTVAEPWPPEPAETAPAGGRGDRNAMERSYQMAMQAQIEQQREYQRIAHRWQEG